jgi:hypothetical protein
VAIGSFPLRVGWIPLDDIRALVGTRHIVAGTTLVALLYLLAEPTSAS